MREAEFVFLIFVLLVGGVFGLVSMRNKARSDELKIIQRTLESGKMDEESRRNLVELLAAGQRRNNQAWDLLRVNASRVVQTIVAVGGWLTLVIGTAVLIGMLVIGANQYDLFGAFIAVGVGFGLVTLPMALREIDARGLQRDRTS